MSECMPKMGRAESTANGLPITSNAKTAVRSIVERYRLILNSLVRVGSSNQQHLANSM